jgi:hypothetical protein
MAQADKTKKLLESIQTHNRLSEGKSVSLSLSEEEAALLVRFYQEGLMMYEGGRETVHREFNYKVKNTPELKDALGSLKKRMKELNSSVEMPKGWD